MQNLTDISTIRDLFERHGFHFSKTLGQNFLINPSVCPRIAEQGGADADTGVIEIGTGVGVLTAELAKRAKKVVAIEIDQRLLPILDETLSEFDNVKIINADVLQLDLRQLIQEEFEGMEVVVCANLPYYITSPIIMGLLEQRLPIKAITVMVQKEAAVRLCAKPATREVGAVTIAVRYFSEPKQLFRVSRGSFLPAPNVDSAVIRLDVHQNAPQTAEDEKVFFQTVRASFSQRRKTVANAVSAVLGIDKTQLVSAMQERGLKPAARAEELTMEQFLILAQIVKPFL